MSDDLISRKALLKELREIMDEPRNTMFLMGIGAAVSIVEHRETAFDKEKVIEGLQNVSLKFRIADNFNGSAVVDRSIEIVEKGGIE